PTMHPLKHVLAATLFAPLAVGSAFAGPPAPEGGGKRPPAVKKLLDIPATQTERTKPAPPRAAPPAESNPSLRVDDVRAAEPEKLHGATQSQLQLMRRLLDNVAAGDPERADLLFRLAGLFDEQRRYFNFRARELDQPIFDASQRGDHALADRLRAR